MIHATLVCLTCNRGLHPTVNFNAGSLICDECANLDKRTLINMALAVRDRQHAAANTAVAQRKNAKQASYLAQGKRCATGQHYRPVTEYDKCNTRTDGLQPSCRACNRLRVSLLGDKKLAPGQGLKLWHLTRDAMRGESAKAASLPGTAPAIASVIEQDTEDTDSSNYT